MSAPEAVVIDRSTIRTRLRKSTQKEFTGAHTKSVLLDMCAILKVEEPAGTKDLIYEQLVANAGLPDQSLRGKSTLGSPVAAMWQHCDDALAAAQAKSEADDEDFIQPRRKDVIATAKADGIAHHTARTQYQCWFNATGRGSVLLADLPTESLPRSMQPADDEVEEA